jgi:hypothetical protein
VGDESAGSWWLDVAIEASVVPSGITERGDFDRLIIELGSKLVRRLVADETNPVRPCRSLIDDGAAHARSLRDSRSRRLDNVPNPAQLVARVSRFFFDADVPRADSWAEIIGIEASIRANTECGGECRIGGVPPSCEAPPCLASHRLLGP